MVPSGQAVAVRSRALSWYLAALGTALRARRAHAAVPRPRDPEPHGAWLAERAAGARRICLTTYASSAVRVCAAARAMGVDLARRRLHRHRRAVHGGPEERRRSRRRATPSSATASTRPARSASVAGSRGRRTTFTCSATCTRSCQRSRTARRLRIRRRRVPGHLAPRLGSQGAAQRGERRLRDRGATAVRLPLGASDWTRISGRSAASRSSRTEGMTFAARRPAPHPRRGAAGALRRAPAPTTSSSRKRATAGSPGWS